jgi:hypothetical protein
VGVDQDRQATARDRRAAIIAALRDGFDASGDSYLSAFKALVARDEPRVLVINADIDGLVSAQMLASVTGWQVGAVIDRNGTVRVHPSFASPQDLVDSAAAFGVDVFSPLFPSISNHPVYFGSKMRSPKALREHLDNFDKDMRQAVEENQSLNPSAWVGISASRGSREPTGIPYKYPLGTAQFLLAVLESAGMNPKIFDRQYLPWLIANCDGGVDTIRTYAWNAEGWWSALAAVVGPASHSESIYRLVTEQRPNEFLDADRRLRYDEPVRSAFLNTKWNLSGNIDAALANVSSLLADLSGWPDPFIGDLAGLADWEAHETSRNLLPLKGITKVDETSAVAHLAAARQGLHVNFSVFRERGTALGWSLPAVNDQIDAVLGRADLDEEIPEDEPTVPDEE